jgi:hypothetical protein
MTSFDWARANADFYEHMEIEYLRTAAARAGLEACPDLDQIWPDIRDARSLLEVGAGYGRVLDGLLARGFRGRLTCVERCATFAGFLQQRFWDRVEVRSGDAASVIDGELFDAVLWLWSGIIEFACEEQASKLQQALAWVKPGGLLAVEAPQLGSETNASATFGQHAIAVAASRKLHVYIPREDQMRDYAGASATMRSLAYGTTSGRRRVLYLFERTQSRSSERLADGAL